MSSNPLVSIIIVNYNNLNILSDCLNSIVCFTQNISYEIIVVDNNTTEGRIETVVNNFDNIILIKSDRNLGFAAANNCGINKSLGEYLLFLNNDTVFIENSVEKILKFVLAQNEDVIAGCKLLNPDMTYQESTVEFPGLWNTFTENFFLYKIFPKSKYFNKYHLNAIQYNEIIEVDVVKGAFLFIASSLIKKMRGFDERFYFYSEETDLCYRFKKSGGKILFFPWTAIIHLGGATTEKILWFKYKQQHIATVQFYQKHFQGLYFSSIILIRYIGILMRTFFYLLNSIILFRKSLFVKAYYYFLQLFVYPKNQFKNSP